MNEQWKTVLCSHLHVDHVGWNTMLVGGEWVAPFTNARYPLADEQYDDCAAGVDWSWSADDGQAAGRATREKLLSTQVDTDVLVIGTHFATPTVGYVKAREAGGWWLDVEGAPLV